VKVLYGRPFTIGVHVDKPELLIAIQQNHPNVSLELIKKFAQEEIDRQIKVSIEGMLYKKPEGILKRIVSYAIEEGKVEEDNSKEYQDGNKSRQASETSGGDSVLDSKLGQAEKEIKKRK
jgi:hypothetical protein